MTFEKSQSAGYLANHMARLFAKGLQDRITPLGITTGQFPILLTLWEADGIPQKKLVAKLGLEQATVANTLNRMERDKLIHRTKDTNDGRTQLIWLTDRTKALQPDAYSAAHDQNAVALSGMSAEEQAQFLALMTKAIQAMQPS